MLEVRQRLRVAALRDRDALPQDSRHEISISITSQLEEYLASSNRTFVHCYISFRSEVETRDFIEGVLAKGWRVVVPVVEVLDGSDVLVHTEIKGLTNLQKGRFGLEEPIERAPSALDDLSAVIIPLAAFDRRGTRLGYGKGYYDAFLSKLPKSVERIGLAFASQEVAHIPPLPHDQPLDVIITEKGIVRVDPTAHNSQRG